MTCYRFKLKTVSLEDHILYNINNCDLFQIFKMISSSCLEINTPRKEFIFSDDVTPTKESFWEMLGKY